MKILFLSHRIPYPPNKGDKIRSFNILRHLAEKHEVHLACLADDKRDLRYKADLLKICKAAEIIYINKFLANFKMLCRLISGQPLTLGYFHSSRLQKTINNWLKAEGCDVIYVFSSGVAQYVLDVKTRKIMDFVDVDSDKWMQNARYAKFPVSLIYRLESLRMKKYEKMILNAFNHSIVITDNEKKLLESFVPDARTAVISNGVDYNYLFKQANFNISDLIIIFTGAMDYFANIDGVIYFHNEIFPLVKQKIKNVKFYVVGSNPAKAVQDLAKDKDVVVTGFVEDIRPYLQKAAVCVVPLRIARGIQNKILEAMSMELPVVTTSQTAKNLNVYPGEDIFVADTPEDFARQVIELLQNENLRLQTGAKARETVKKHYDWQKNLAKIDALLIS